MTGIADEAVPQEQETMMAVVIRGRGDNGCAVHSAL